MIRRNVTVTLENGLHMVPASAIAKTAKNFHGRVVLRHNDIIADARSLLDLLQLKADFGVTLELEADGEGAADVVDAIVHLFASNFADAHQAHAPAPETNGP